VYLAAGLLPLEGVDEFGAPNALPVDATITAAADTASWVTTLALTMTPLRN
jgi:hypothetical protein